MRRRFIPQKVGKQRKGEDRTEMKPESKLLRCTLLNGSAWSTERKYILIIFFGVEHRLRKEEMEEQFNKEVKEGWIFAADAARITDERAGSDVQVCQLLLQEHVEMVGAGNVACATSTRPAAINGAVHSIDHTVLLAHTR